jgi:hypothetical protein
MPRACRAALCAVTAAVACAVLAAPAPAATVWAVGDGSNAGPGDDAVAQRIQASGIDHLLYLGDVYQGGSAAEFRNWYAPSYGRFKAITSPTPGNHDFFSRAQGYDPYWGPGVRQPNGGHYYSLDLDGWHVISLNSEEPIGYGSRQLGWLRRDLDRYPGSCTIAFQHRPRFSASGPEPDQPWLEPVWSMLAGHTVAFLNGHSHNYQRMRPVSGMTEFTVGTGGLDLKDVNERDPRLAARNEREFGALRLRLGLGQALFDFVAVSGARRDRGRLECAPHQPVPTRLRIVGLRDRGSYPAVRTLRGRAINVRRLRLRLVRSSRRRCRVFDGRLFRRAPCRTRRSVPVEARPRWRFALPSGRPLAPGAYRLTVQARGLDLRVVSRTVRFRVGARRQ